MGTENLGKSRKNSRYEARFSFYVGYGDRKSTRFPKVVDFFRKSRFFRRFSELKLLKRKSRENTNIFRYTIDINIILVWCDHISLYLSYLVKNNI